MQFEGVCCDHFCAGKDPCSNNEPGCSKVTCPPLPTRLPSRHGHHSMPLETPSGTPVFRMSEDGVWHITTSQRNIEIQLGELGRRGAYSCLLVIFAARARVSLMQTPAILVPHLDKFAHACADAFACTPMGASCGSELLKRSGSRKKRRHSLPTFGRL